MATNVYPVNSDILKKLARFSIMNRPRSSRQRYLSFVKDYRRRRLDEEGENRSESEDPASKPRGKRREYLFLLLNPVWNIVNSFSELQRSLAAMERSTVMARSCDLFRLSETNQ